jgi:hypothetical protein
MKTVLDSKFFRLLSEPSNVTNDKIQKAYGHFMECIRIFSQSEETFSEIFRMLNITRIELISKESYYRYGQGGKCA